MDDPVRYGFLVSGGSTLTFCDSEGRPRWALGVGACIGEPDRTVSALGVSPGRIVVRLDSDVLVGVGGRSSP